MDIVYVEPDDKFEWYREDYCWKCSSPNEAFSLVKWLQQLGLNAKQIDETTFNQMPDKIII